MPLDSLCRIVIESDGPARPHLDLVIQALIVISLTISRRKPSLVATAPEEARDGVHRGGGLFS